MGWLVTFRNRSLTFKLLVGTLAVLTGYVVAIGILAYLSARDSIDDAYDVSLIVNANALLFLMQEEAAEGGLDKPLNFNVSADALKGKDKNIFASMSEYRMLRVWYKGAVVLTSDDSLTAAVQPFPEGFSDQRFGGHDWRIYSLHLPKEQLSVELGEQQNARRALVISIAKDLVLPFLISLPIVVLMFWGAIRSGMKDLHKVTRQVNTRSPEQMMPLEAANLPPDLLPLVSAINALLKRLDQSLSRERQITELAAHELRTPLAAIKLQAQMGLKAADDKGRVAALCGLLEGVERAAHLVEQLLTLTRVEQTKFDLYQVDAAEACARVARELLPLSERRSQQIILQMEPRLIAYANEDLLRLTLINLIGNAVKYSPEHSAITVVGRKQEDKVEIDVIDEGPGIPEKIGEKIFERFFRYHTGKTLGSGLGLAIARQSAEQMKASLSLHTPGRGGLRVSLALMGADQKSTVAT